MSQMSDKKDDEFRIELKTSGAKNISFFFLASLMKCHVKENV